MHLNQIHSYLAVSKTLNFTGAARQLGVPQSTISRQINDLESQLGVRLFYRTKRDVQLTDEGRIFLPYAQEIADAARKGSYAVRQLHEGASGSLSIATTSASRAILPGVLSAFHDLHPDITVDITPISGGMGLMDDTDAPYDFWFLYREMLLDPESFDYLHIYRQPLHIARRKTETKTGKADAKDGKAGVETGTDNTIGSSARKDPAEGMPDLKDLSTESFILLSEEEDPILYMQIMNYCRTHHFTPRVANTFQDLSSVLLSVSAGLGITILPESLLRTVSIDEIETIPLGDESYDLDCIAVWKPSLLNPAAKLFLQVLQEQL